ncbi:MerR family transcriptional regulator [Sphingomonas cynarae]|uniref:MerR family transcriptional regulator n=1 Tax=Sphingomonas cynarae TaxID=930197 RepID=A0ABP7EUJ2_9SPHN
MKISDFAAHSGLTPDTIRYYERIGLLPRTVRDAGGRRSYGMDDLAWASFLRKLQAMDMPMRDRLEYSRLRAMGRATTADRRAMLEAHRAALANRRDELMELIGTLDAKIAHYRDLEANMEGSSDDGSTRSNGGSGRAAPRRDASIGAARRG